MYNGPTSTDSRDQEIHIFQVRFIIKKPSTGRARQRITPNTAPIRKGEFTYLVCKTPAPAAPVDPHHHEKTCLQHRLEHNCKLYDGSTSQTDCSSCPSPAAHQPCSQARLTAGSEHPHLIHIWPQHGLPPQPLQMLAEPVQQRPLFLLV